MKLRLSTDLVTGVLFMALGGFAIVYGSRYAVGTPRAWARYFPMLISSGLLLVGAVLVVRCAARLLASALGGDPLAPAAC